MFFGKTSFPLINTRGIKSPMGYYTLTMEFHIAFQNHDNPARFRATTHHPKRTGRFSCTSGFSKTIEKIACRVSAVRNS